MPDVRPYDSAEFLRGDADAIRYYLDEALSTGDPELYAHAIRIVLRAEAMDAVNPHPMALTEH